MTRKTKMKFLKPYCAYILDSKNHIPRNDLFTVENVRGVRETMFLCEERHDLHQDYHRGWPRYTK